MSKGRTRSCERLGFRRSVSYHDFTSKLAFTFTPFRWAWQSIPVLQLPPVQTIGAVGSVGSTNEGSSKSRPRSLMAKVESRVFQLKEDNGVESALRAAEEILRQRRRWEDIGHCLRMYV